MNRYNVTIKRIGLALVCLANVATILGWTWLAIHHWP